MTYFISDLHFGHNNIIRFDQRPFFDVKEMDKTIIKNWNSVVTSEDTVYILGDVSWYGEKETGEILKQLNGTLFLIKGNHDHINPTLRKKFKEIVDYKEITVDNKKVILSHYPIMFYNGQYNNSIHLYGHVHTTRDYILLLSFMKQTKTLGIPCNMYNVGCMINNINYIPRTLDEIIGSIVYE